MVASYSISHLISNYLLILIRQAPILDFWDFYNAPLSTHCHNNTNSFSYTSSTHVDLPIDLTVMNWQLLHRRPPVFQWCLYSEQVAAISCALWIDARFVRVAAIVCIECTRLHLVKIRFASLFPWKMLLSRGLLLERLLMQHAPETARLCVWYESPSPMQAFFEEFRESVFEITCSR